MDKAEIKKIIEDVISEILSLSDVSVNDDSVAGDFEGWDSFSHVRIISRIERRLGIQIPLLQAARFRSIGELIDFLHRELNP